MAEVARGLKDGGFKLRFREEYVGRHMIPSRRGNRAVLVMHGVFNEALRKWGKLKPFLLED